MSTLSTRATTAATARAAAMATATATATPRLAPYSPALTFITELMKTNEVLDRCMDRKKTEALTARNKTGGKAGSTPVLPMRKRAELRCRNMQEKKINKQIGENRCVSTYRCRDNGHLPCQNSWRSRPTACRRATSSRRVMCPRDGGGTAMVRAQ